MSGNTSVSSSSFYVKLNIYSHYGFNKISIKRQRILPTLGEEILDQEYTAANAVSDNTPFNSNYIKVFECNTVSAPGATEKWTYIVTDNQGKETYAFLNITVLNNNL